MPFKEMLLFSQKLSTWLYSIVIHSLGGSCYLNTSCLISVHRLVGLATCRDAWYHLLRSNSNSWLTPLPGQPRYCTDVPPFLVFKQSALFPLVIPSLLSYSVSFGLCLVHLVLQSRVYVYSPLLTHIFLTYIINGKEVINVHGAFTNYLQSCTCQSLSHYTQESINLV